MSLISFEHQSGKAFKVSVREHEFVSDASQQDGGEDLGPQSAELFVAALGACIGVMVVTYCQTAKLPYEGMEIDCAFDTAPDPKRIAGIALDITMPSDFPKSRRKAVERAAQACLIHNTLHHPPEISIEVVD